MKEFRFIFFISILFNLSVPALHAVQLASAKALNVSGSAYIHTESGDEKPLTVGAILVQGDRLMTANTGNVRLVFSNGSELTVKENSSLVFTELSQEPYLSNKTYTQLKADPSESKWLLKLNYGKLEGHVKQLRLDSKFAVETEFGTALIHGNQFAIEYYFDYGSNEFVVGFQNIDGVVEVLSRLSDNTNYGRGKIVSASFNKESEFKKVPVPPEHALKIRHSGRDPDYRDLIPQFSESFAAEISQAELEDALEITPSDQPVVSPNTP